jgi:ATP-dependent exoDNAse (exonuclease V) alpha subunit
MALFHLRINSITRSGGRCATAAAAYRAGESIRDQRTGRLHNYSKRRDVRHAEIFLPGTVAAGEAAWARERARLWNAAEAAEHRRDSRVAREVQVSLPSELTGAQRQELARAFSQELADRYRVAVDLAIHEPRPDGDPRNHHAHLLLTTREIGAAGPGARALLEVSFDEQRKRGLTRPTKEYSAIRERWAMFVNDALRSAGLEERVDHRSLKAQGIDREPRHVPFIFYQIERRALGRGTAERIYQRYRERVAAHASLTREPSGLEEVRRRARDAWQRLRTDALQSSPGRKGSKRQQVERQRTSEVSADADAAREAALRAADEDLAL